ncbi:MAG: aspartyl protease family protein [Halioglobus sp.]|nr:aspartyl protease family protein [Halioglobus sp.]
MSTSDYVCRAAGRPSSLACVATAVALAVGGMLAPNGLRADGDAAAPGHAGPTAETLLAGAATAERDFRVTAGFRLTQNTIQLDTSVDSSPDVDTFILDSGAPMTIASSLVDELGLEPLASIGLAGPEGGHRQVPVVQIPDIRIAGVSFRGVGAVVDWVEPPDQLACLSRSGLMGASLLQAAIWQIDFASQNITMTDSLASLGSMDNAIRIPFTRADAAGSPRIAVGVSDSSEVSLLIDLGFNGSIAIPSATLERAGDRIPETAPTETGQASSTVFGHTSSEVHITRVRELRMGTLRLRDFPVFTGPSVSDFHVGIDFLRHFRVTLDWHNNALYLEPRDPVSALYNDFPTYGFAPQLRDGELVVGALWRGSSGEKAGLALGDQLLEIDGRDTSKPDFETVCSLLNEVALYGSKNTPISVTRLRAGVRETLRIERAPLLTAREPAARE